MFVLCIYNDQVHFFADTFPMYSRKHGREISEKQLTILAKEKIL